MPSMQTSDVTFERLQRLASVEAPGGARVLSLYLNLDPHANLAAPVNRRTAVNSLLDEAARAAEEQDGLDHDAHMALRKDVTRARDAFDANLDDDWAEGAHALALFVSGPADLFEVVKLARPVDNAVVIDDRPAIGRAAETGPVEPWAVLVTDGDDARLFAGVGARLTEVEHQSSDHENRTSRGAQSALRWERPIGMEEHDFLRDVARHLSAQDRDRNFARILVGTTERHYGVFEPLVEPHTREKIIGRFDAGADWESP